MKTWECFERDINMYLDCVTVNEGMTVGTRVVPVVGIKTTRQALKILMWACFFLSLWFNITCSWTRCSCTVSHQVDTFQWAGAMFSVLSMSDTCWAKCKVTLLQGPWSLFEVAEWVFCLLVLCFQIAKVEKLKPLEVELRRLEDLSESIVNDFAYMKRREEEMRDTNGKHHQLFVIMTLKGTESRVRVC